MMHYIFIDVHSKERVHRIKSEGQIDVHESMPMFIGDSIYMVTKKPYLLVFKENDLNIYTVYVLKTNESAKEHMKDVMPHIQDIIRESKIDSVVD